MAEEKKKGGDFSLPNAGVIAIVLSLVGSLIIGPSAFIDERPNTSESVNSDTGYEQDIDARLWQDPFLAIKKDMEKTSSKATNLVFSRKDDSTFKIEIMEHLAPKEKNEHSPLQPFLNWENLPWTNTEPEVTIIAAMVTAGPYSEMQEKRIRQRYALASALSTLRFKPRDPLHIGYFKPAFHQSGGLKRKDLPDAIPFEWYEPQEHNEAIKCWEQNAIQCSRVLVLWIDDTRFGDRPVEKIREIFRQVASHAPNKFVPRYAVIGPNDSGQLKAMVQEALRQNENSFPGKIRFYPATATAEDSWILNGLPKTPANVDLASALSNEYISLTRTISDDRQVSKKLVEELGFRQVNSVRNHIVLISEWDTFYGRALPLTFASAYMGEANRQPEPEAKWQRPRSKHSNSYIASSECESFSSPLVPDGLPTGRVHCFSYVRGIDGKLPKSMAKEENKNGSEAKPNEKKSAAPYDRPDGLSQKDYLRRLVEQIRELDHKLNDQDNDCLIDTSQRCGVSAIGVLGYDVYDKLALLQALRPYFPGKIFFTTELDALYSSPHEFPHTHNLIVASSFGLSLRPEIQKNVPPFRGSYQTAFFLATLLAVLDEKKAQDSLLPSSQLPKWLKNPRVFEIGRKGPVNIGGDRSYPSCENYLFACDDIHPPNVWNRPRSNVAMLQWLLLGFGICLLYRANWGFRKITRHVVCEILAIARAPSLRWKAALSIWLLAMTIVILWVFLPSNQEPFLWADGISIWPSELIRITALIASILFILKIREKLSKDKKHLEDKYDLQATTKSAPLREGLTSIYDWKDAPHDPKITINGQVEINMLWGQYCEKNAFHARLTRATINLMMFMVFSYVAILASGGLPVPGRGELAFYFDKAISFLAGISVLLLTMVVVDAARLGDRLIYHINSNGAPSNWPCAKKYAQDWGFSCEDSVIYWIDVRFVADLTDMIGKFIWYPIISLLLLIAARSSIFDDSVFSYGLVVSISILLLYLFSCAFWLQISAKNMREKAIRELGKKLRTLRGKIQNNKEIITLENMIKETESIEKGAFTPFMQQPPVRAILAIIGGGSGLPLLEHFF